MLVAVEAVAKQAIGMKHQKAILGRSGNPD
jgi:hypothetical protein